MVQSPAATVDEYLGELPEARREVVARLRALARSTLAGFEESMRYGMPTYLRGPSDSVAFASQVQYVSVYVGQRVLSEHRSRLRGAKVGKGCVRFTRSDRIDFAVIASMFRAAATVRSPSPARGRIRPSQGSGAEAGPRASTRTSKSRPSHDSRRVQ